VVDSAGECDCWWPGVYHITDTVYDALPVSTGCKSDSDEKDSQAQKITQLPQWQQ